MFNHMSLKAVVMAKNDNRTSNKFANFTYLHNLNQLPVVYLEFTVVVLMMPHGAIGL